MAYGVTDSGGTQSMGTGFVVPGTDSAFKTEVSCFHRPNGPNVRLV